MTDEKLIAWGAMEEKDFLRLIPPKERERWWMCPCGCRNWFKQKSKESADRLRNKTRYYD